MEQEKYEAIIEHNGDEKYIVAEVGDDEKSRPVIVSMPLGYHQDIFRTYVSRLNGGEKVKKVLGGGILTIDRIAKTVKTYGKSGGFGKPDVSLLEKILRTCLPDFTVDAQVTDYVRG